MRTLKKSLCLVLALLFVLGLCTIGAGATFADYTDKEDVQYADAVEVLTGLQVIEGYTDGSFKPAANVTRAEAAAMITRMMLGREGADKLPIGDVKFTDVPETSWAAKYIAFCANKGIIVGMGDGTFHPNENVTGTQMATMLLRALGYGVMGEYEGKGWDINAVADALYYKIFEDSKVTDFSKPATREETALYVFNTLWVQLVAYDVDIDHYVIQIGTFASEVFSLARVEGLQVEANQATGDPYTVINGRNYDIVTGLDLIAHEVTLYYKTDSRDKDKANNYFWKAYLVQDNSTVLEAGSTWASMFKALKAANKTNVDAPYDKLANVDVWVNYVYGVTSDTLAGDVGAKTVNELKGWETKSNNLDGDIVLDSNGHMLAYLKLEYTVDQVKKIVGDEIYLRDNLYADDFEYYDLALAYEGIAKDDYVTVQPVGKLCYLYPTTTSEISVFERNVLTDYILIGVDYPCFNFFALMPSQGYRCVEPAGTEDPFNVNAGDKCLFYMDYYGKFFAVEILERGTLDGVVYVNYVFNKDGVDDYGDPDTTVYVQAVNEKGEEVVYALNKDTYKTTGAVSKGIYKVYLDKKGFATLSKTGSYVQKEDGKSTALTKDGNVYYVGKDTKIYYVNGIKGDMKVTKAQALPSAGAYGVWAYSTTNGTTYNAQTLWVINETAPKTSDSYMYIYGDTYGYKMNGGTMLINETKTYYFETYIDGVKNSGTFIAGEDTTELGGFTYVLGGFYIYSTDEFNVYDLDAVTDSDVLKVKNEVVLTAGDIHGGKLYYDADGVKLDVSVVVVNKKNCVTADGKRYLTIETVDDIEDILEDGGTVTVSYVAAVSNKDLVPVGTIYVVAATEGED